MFPLSHDPIDGFRALFGAGEVMLDGGSVPLGACAVDVLNLSKDELRVLGAASSELRTKVMMVLSGPDAAGAALAQEALEKFWETLSRYPIYRHLEAHHESLPHAVGTNPGLLQSMLTTGTKDSAAMTEWFAHLAALSETFRRFREHAAELLERAFTDVPERNASGYARQLTGYYTSADLELLTLSDELRGEEFMRTRENDLRESETVNFPKSFQLRVSYRAVPHPKRQGEYLLAEQVFFDEPETFLYLDLLRGLAAGHLPRRCEHCERWFLLTSGYDTRYCENPAPGEPGVKPAGRLARIERRRGSMARTRSAMSTGASATGSRGRSTGGRCPSTSGTVL